MTTNFLELATTLKYLGAKWLTEKKVNFTPCGSPTGGFKYSNLTGKRYFVILFGKLVPEEWWSLSRGGRNQRCSVNYQTFVYFSLSDLPSR